MGTRMIHALYISCACVSLIRYWLHKNVYVSVLVFSVNSKNLNIGCTARFGEINQEKTVFATSGEKTIAHACSGKTPGSSARALQLVST